MQLHPWPPLADTSAPLSVYNVPRRCLASPGTESSLFARPVFFSQSSLFLFTVAAVANGIFNVIFKRFIDMQLIYNVVLISSEQQMIQLCV